MSVSVPLSGKYPASHMFPDGKLLQEKPQAQPHTGQVGGWVRPAVTPGRGAVLLGAAQTWWCRTQTRCTSATSLPAWLSGCPLSPTARASSAGSSQLLRSGTWSCTPMSLASTSHPPLPAGVPTCEAHRTEGSRVWPFSFAWDTKFSVVGPSSPAPQSWCSRGFGKCSEATQRALQWCLAPLPPARGALSWAPAHTGRISWWTPCIFSLFLDFLHV